MKSSGHPLEHLKQYNVNVLSMFLTDILTEGAPDWASDSVTHQSTTRYMISLASRVFSWNSRAQKTVTLSSTEAEYMSLSDTSRQIV